MAKRNKQRAVVISPQAKEDILYAIVYLKAHWGQKVVDQFLQKLETFYRIISINPRLSDIITKAEISVNMQYQNKTSSITAVRKMQ